MSKVNNRWINYIGSVEGNKLKRLITKIIPINFQTQEQKIEVFFSQNIDIRKLENIETKYNLTPFIKNCLAQGVGHFKLNDLIMYCVANDANKYRSKYTLHVIGHGKLRNPDYTMQNWWSDFEDFYLLDTVALESSFVDKTNEMIDKVNKAIKMVIPPISVLWKPSYRRGIPVGLFINTLNELEGALIDIGDFRSKHFLTCLEKFRSIESGVDPEQYSYVVQRFSRFYSIGVKIDKVYITLTDEIRHLYELSYCISKDLKLI